MPVIRTVQQLHDLSGRTALITGGSRGLGFQTTQALGEAGALDLADAAMTRPGQLDIPVDNTSTTWAALAEDQPTTAWDKVMNLNLRGVFSSRRAEHLVGGGASAVVG